MKIRGELKDRNHDSCYIYELFQLPKFNESVAKGIEHPSLIAGIIYYENTAVYPTKTRMGAYVIVDCMEGEEKKQFVSIEDPVYEGDDAEMGKYEAGYKAIEMADRIASVLNDDIGDLTALKEQLYKSKLLSSPSQN